MLWKSVRDALDIYRGQAPKVEPEYPEPLEIARRLLASCYARLRMGQAVQPLRQIVTDGVVLGLVAQGSVRIEELAQRLRKLMPLTEEEAAAQVAVSVEDLIVKERLIRDGDVVSLARPLENHLEQEMSVLVEGIANRLVVREGHEPAVGEREVIRRVMEDAVLLRGWDLGASFAAARRSDSFDVWPILRWSLRRHGSNIGEAVRERIASASVDLFRRPDADEARILVNLGRLAFGKLSGG